MAGDRVELSLFQGKTGPRHWKRVKRSPLRDLMPVLSAMQEPVTQAALANASGLSEGEAKRAVHLGIREGLIKKVDNKLIATEKGSLHFPATPAAHGKIADEALGKIDFSQLIDTLP